MGGTVEGFEEKGSYNGLFTNNTGWKARTRVKSVCRGTNYYDKSRFHPGSVHLKNSNKWWLPPLGVVKNSKKRGACIEFAFVFAGHGLSIEKKEGKVQNYKT